MYIPQIPAKDLWVSNYGCNSEYSLLRKDGQLNTKRFRASFDYSLDLIKLREIYESVYRNKKFSTVIDDKEYSYRIVNVTFDYSVKTFNRAGNNSYCKLGYDERKLVYDDCVCVVDGELVGIRCNEQVNNPIDDSLLCPYFSFKDGKYITAKPVATEKTVAEVRSEIYENGFVIDGIKFVRWKRSAGSARVGRCLFIDERLFDRMRKWECCGITVSEGDSVDLATYESYISLTSSSIIDTMCISPENILVIDDYSSIFNEDVISVTESDGVLDANHEVVSIENSIFDGESVIDKSIMGKYDDKGMLLLRNRFFKSCTFSSNIQQWFEDNGVTSVDQLNGFTLANDIKDIKLITTPSSIKYCKFGTVEEWFKNYEPVFGIVKYEKPPHFFEGRLVQAHYQLINSIQLTRDEVDELLKPTFDFMSLIKSNPAALRYWIKFNIDQLDEITPLESKTDVIYKLMSINDDFSKTKLYYDFRSDFLKSFTKNLKCGHVLINGNYSTLCGNPIEMLRAAIGKFDGTSTITNGTVYSKRFEFGKELLGSRSPHITFSNVLVTKNEKNELIEKYMNPSKEIVYVNSINENIMQRLAGCDYDSDTIMITDNEVLIRGAKRWDGKFPVAAYMVGGAKVKRRYTHEDLSDLDIKTSKNLIGEIINVSQELNSRVWDMLYSGKSIEDISGIYKDICKLSIMSNIEIDKAKKEFVIDNAYELDMIRKKYKIVQEDGRSVKPNFFAHIAKRKGYYDPVKKAYVKHNTSMDYLQTSVNSFRSRRVGKASKNEFLPFSEMINTNLAEGCQVNYRQINDLISFIDETDSHISQIYSNDTMSSETQNTLAFAYRQDCVEEVGEINFNPATMAALLKTIEKPEHSKHRRMIFYTLFGYPNSSFYDMLDKTKKPLKKIKKCHSGDIDIYGTKFVMTDCNCS